MSKRKKITPAIETKVLALIARGDTYKEIQKTIAKEDDHNIAPPAISLIKKNNKEALATIQQAMAQDSLSRVQRTTNKANKVLEDTIDQHQWSLDKERELRQMLVDGEIDTQEYAERATGLHKIQVKDVIGISKETFRQAQLAEGKPTGISESPEQAKQQLVQFLQIINTGDPEKIHDLIFGLTEQQKSSGEAVDVESEEVST